MSKQKPESRTVRDVTPVAASAIVAGPAASAAIMNMPDDLPAPSGGQPAFQPPPPAGIVSDFDTAFMEQDAELNALMDELGAQGYESGTVNVSKVNARTRRLEWIDKKTVPEFLASGVRELATYGAGDYHITVYVPGHRGIKNRTVITVSEAAAAREQREMRSQIVTAPAPAPAPASSEMAEVREMIKGLVGIVGQVVTQRQAPPQNPLAQMREMAEVMRMLQPQPRQENSFTMFREMLGMVREMTPIQDEGAGGFVQLLDKFATRFGPLLMQQAQAASGAPRLPAGPAPSHAQPDNPDGAGDVNMQQMALKQGVMLLVKAAANNNDPATYAGLVLDNVPRETLSQWLAAPTLLDSLAQFVPEVKNYPAWFEELRAVAIKMLEDEAAAAGG